MPVAIKDLLETKDMPTQLGPLMSVGGLPVGVQLMGQQHEDARVTAMARWMLGAVPPVVA